MLGRKQKRNLGLAGSFLAIGMGFSGLFVLAFSSLNTREAAEPTRRLSAIESLPVPSVPKPSIFLKQLQVPPPPSEAERNRPAVQRVNWPPITVECVFLGSESSLAVVASNGTKFRVSTGDVAMGVTTEEINEDSVVFSKQGQRKTVSIEKSEVNR